MNVYPTKNQERIFFMSQNNKKESKNQKQDTDIIGVPPTVPYPPVPNRAWTEMNVSKNGKDKPKNKNK